MIIVFQIIAVRYKGVEACVVTGLETSGWLVYTAGSLKELEPQWVLLEVVSFRIVRIKLEASSQ